MSEKITVKLEIIKINCFQVGPCEYQNATKEAWCKGFNRVPSLDEKVFRDTLYEVGPIAVSVNATHPSFKFYKDGELGVTPMIRCEQVYVYIHVKGTLSKKR